MASGCPCIVADTGGLREVVPNDDVGLRFRARDPRALAETMTLVLANPAVRFRLVGEAGVHVRRFDWAGVALQTAAVYGIAGARCAAAACDAPPDRGTAVACAACPSCCWSRRRRDWTYATWSARSSDRRPRA